jgi:molybdate transport system substrate-binding protein
MSGGPSDNVVILTSNSSRTVLDGLASRCVEATTHAYDVRFDSAKSMLARIKGGEAGDIVILDSGYVDELAALGSVRPASRRPFALARIGVAVRAGAPRPDISSPEAFKRAMLNARSIAHTVHGASGMYVPVLFERLGISEQVRAKIVTRPGGYIATVVASGEAELAVQQIVELRAVQGVDVVGPLPDALQKVFRTDAAILAGSGRSAQAERCLGFLSSPLAAAVFTQVGLEQAPQRAR